MAVRQLSAIYLAAASGYTLAIALAQHPMLAKQADDAGHYVQVHGVEAAVALNAQVIVPGFKFAAAETGLLEQNVLEPGWKLALREIGEMQQRVAQAIASQPQKAPTAVPTRLASAISQRPRPERNRDIPWQQQARTRVMAALSAAPDRLPPVEGTGLRGGIDEVPSVQFDSDSAAQVPGNPAVTTNPSQRRVAVSESQPPTALQLAPQTVPPLAQSEPVPGAASALPNLPPPSPGELARIEQRLKDSLTPEMKENFGLFLYVSKAAAGPLAQRMYVFQRSDSGDLTLAYNWPVSTGRERIEFNALGKKLPSFTPAGYYELDPKRSFVHYRSIQWGQQMPYAMFFNWRKNGYATGLAIHSATGDDIAQLGTRASAGCVRLAPEAARTLFTLIRTQYRGLAPRFAIDRRTGTMSNEGIMLHDANGHVQLAEGYRVLVFIENFGGENVVAALFGS